MGRRGGGGGGGEGGGALELQPNLLRFWELCYYLQSPL